MLDIELKRLAEAFNRMLERLDASFKQRPVSAVPI
jgi:hypothetical protein